MQRRDGLAALLALPFVSALPVRAAEAKRRITVYTAVEPEWLAVYRNAFAAVRPDIEITYVRASGGPICARLLAEKDRVQADAVLGGVSHCSGKPQSQRYFGALCSARGREAQSQDGGKG